MIKSLTKMVLIFLIPIILMSAESDPPRLKILHPKPDMQFWVDQIEVAGDIPPGTDVTIMGKQMVPDEEGRFRHMITLDRPETFIYITETRDVTTLRDTIRVFHRNLDHLIEDSSFVNNNVPEKLDLQLGFPKSGVYRGSEVSLRGKTHPDATLTVNGDTLHVYESGAFTTHVEILEGENKFDFNASWKGFEIIERLTLSSAPTKTPPTKLDSRSARPLHEEWVLAGDHFQAGIEGPAGAKVYCKIPNVSTWQLMTEVKPGQYQTYIHLLDIDDELNTSVLYRMGILSHRIKSAPLRILTDALGGLTIHEDTRVYDTPSTDQLFFPLADSVSVQIIGLVNKMYRITLGEHRTAYVLAERVELNESGRRYSAHYLGSMRSENVNDWTVFRIPTGSTRLPFELKEKAVPSRLELKVYGAKQGWEWTTYPEDDSAIAFLERSQPEDMVWQMDFFPAQKFWGWYGRYEGDELVIGIRKAPLISPDSLFANILIEIDPGHGGWQRGAVGITGYAEADANLRYCLKLEKKLLDAGATVFMTRRDDHQIDLDERARIARDDSVHIFVMAHNNAPGSSRNLEEARGASTFFTWPSTKLLSDSVYPHLHNMGIDTSGKVSRYYYYLTRQTEYLVYLIEGAFMTNPNEEMFLLSEEGLESLAEAAFLGLKDFMIEQASPVTDN
ncbi:MAG: N-acetylmuramoyl-L-alanine amidase [Candidatus Marinimicrobia bacterium]|nr:N-acetylmuramoyl-L-alanine amidase [Candidatus Neomarinimicrobiota bacterium]